MPFVRALGITSVLPVFGNYDSCFHSIIATLKGNEDMVGQYIMYRGDQIDYQMRFRDEAETSWR
jgi:hypothetical protein